MKAIARQLDQISDVSQSHVVLACENVSLVRHLRNATPETVLNEINFEIRRREFVVLMGPSGCGKTSLLKTLCGLLQPSGGSIHVEGKEDGRLSRDVAIVFQEAGLFPWLSVRGNIDFPLRIEGLDSVSRRERTDSLIESLDMQEWSAKFPHELSGGMKQRVSIARALAAHRAILLMDEPLAALDQQVRSEIQGFILDVWRKMERTILFVTHQVEEAIVLADRILVMNTGPGTLVDAIDVSLPRPRDVTSDEFNQYRKRVVTSLSQSR